MRVLIVLHGRLPPAPVPLSGGAIRAWNHGEALRSAGHEVVYLTREQDGWPEGPQTFANPRQLRALARAIAPDRILCVQPEEAPALAGLGAPLCVDLYAPRLLEAAFEGPVSAEAVHTLRAIAAADHFLFSNPRQRWGALGLLALAGVDLRAPVGDVVPLVAPEGPRRRPPRAPLLVMGGVPWPWQDPTDALTRAVAVLSARGAGTVRVFGDRPAVGDGAVVDLPARVPPGPHLEYAGSLPWPDLLAAYAGATLALDVTAPNAERELALSFRQVDYLGCGLPLVTGAWHALSDDLREAEAGWVVDDAGPGLEAALREALDDPEELRRRGRNARALARARFSREVAEAPLLRWVETATVREKAPAALAEAAELSAALTVARAEVAHEAALRGRAEAELADKRAEVGRLAEQLAQLSGTVERLSRAVDEVAGFKREAVRVLGLRAEGVAEEARNLERELADIRADLAKKDAELRAATREQHRLNDALAAARDEAGYAGRRLEEAGRREDKLRREREVLETELGRSVLARVLGRLRG